MVGMCIVGVYLLKQYQFYKTDTFKNPTKICLYNINFTVYISMLKHKPFSLLKHIFFSLIKKTSKNKLAMFLNPVAFKINKNSVLRHVYEIFYNLGHNNTIFHAKQLMMFAELISKFSWRLIGNIT